MLARILAVGLTGGIACGKSVVTRTLGEQGAIVLDADEIAHKLMEPGGAGYGPLVERFGREVLDERGGVDRRILGARIFADPRERWALNAIMHPLVIKEEERLHQEVRLLREDRIVVTDAALLFEAGTHKRFDCVVVVYCSPEEQLRRLEHRDGLTREIALQRIGSQMPVEEKMKHADYTLETTGTEEDTREKARGLFSKLQADLERKFG